LRGNGTSEPQAIDRVFLGVPGVTSRFRALIVAKAALEGQGEVGHIEIGSPAAAHQGAAHLLWR
jgi:hypothetical protein